MVLTNEACRKEHFGKPNMANNGMMMYIIAYRGTDDVDIVFQDGTIVKNKRYKNFNKGKVGNPNKGNIPEVPRIGETNVANNGQRMIIVGYRNCKDIDIMFDDGTIVKNKEYIHFKKGQIGNPNKPSSNFYLAKTNRVGETAIANNGQKMTIVTYRNRDDIDIAFEDGLIVYNKRYTNFQNGKIAHPNIQAKQENEKKDCRVGESRIANNGQQMTIVAYRNRKDIDIKFEDGTIVEHRAYKNFKTGQIANPKLVAEKKAKRHPKVGQTNIANNGQKITIIAYRKYNDIDVEFEDGTIVEHKAYQSFKKGEIKNPNVEAINHIGETIKASNNQIMTIIEYRNNTDVDVQFEDGTIVKHKAYNNFKCGKIKNPNKPTPKYRKHKTSKCKLFRNCKTNKPKRKPNRISKSSRVGETSIANNGQQMTIIAYRKYRDVDIQFEDGTIVYNKQYIDFKRGRVGNPNFKK